MILYEKIESKTYSAVPVPTFLLTTISGIHPAGLSKTLTPSLPSNLVAVFLNPAHTAANRLYPKDRKIFKFNQV